MDLEKTSQRTWWQRWRIYILAAIAIVIIVVIVVPLAVILPRRHHSTPAATVMLPLYIYPSNESVWDPLYQA
jgi:anti-sigma-K factor RskA